MPLKVPFWFLNFGTDIFIVVLFAEI